MFWKVHVPSPQSAKPGEKWVASINTKPCTNKCVPFITQRAQSYGGIKGPILPYRGITHVGQRKLNEFQHAVSCSFLHWRGMGKDLGLAFSMGQKKVAASLIYRCWETQRVKKLFAS